MKLTEEQRVIIESDQDICINAVAGSGKTSTLIAYAAAKTNSSRILYLAFNRVIRNEAEAKFRAAGLHKVDVETAHSLAFKHVVPMFGYRLQNNGYKLTELVEVLALNTSVDPKQVYFVAAHVNRLVALYCNSAAMDIKDVDYPVTIDDAKIRGMVAGQFARILREAQKFLHMMERGEIAVTHDFYLKKFQLSAPKLNYDYILFDEGQDASAVMLDIFLKQKAVKVMVGDMHQQIYGWRYAVNALEMTHFPVMNLSLSFRFNQQVAFLAAETIRLKRVIGKPFEVNIFGGGGSKTTKLKAVIARTNLGLLVEAIEHVSPPRAIRSLYFEGNFNAYTYAENGASLYDVLYLYNQEHQKIKDKLIRSMKTLADLKSYAEETGDQQLKMMAEVVKKYGNALPQLLRTIRQKHVDDKDRQKAEVIFSTVHRCKGMEYDIVQLANDFITEKKLRRAMEHAEKALPDIEKLKEEINLLYVAITRTKNLLYIPDTLVPEGYLGTEHIRILRTEPDLWTPDFEVEDLPPVQPSKPKLVIRKKWTNQEDELLMEMFLDGKRYSTMARKFGVSEGAIKTRLRKIAGTTSAAMARLVLDAND